MRKVVLCILALTLAASPGWAAGLKLVMHDGKVSLDAQEVTLRQILAEWAKVGKTRIINVERVTSGPMTLQLDGVPEVQALEIVLRSVPGYMAAPRAEAVADASIYDRILIMPTTAAVAPPRQSTTGPQTPFPSFPQPGPGVTQLRGARPPLVPGSVPEADNDDLNDPAIAAAAAAGLFVTPAPTPVYAVIDSAIQPASGTPRVVPPTNAAPAPIWTAPAGTAQPSLPSPVPPAPTRPGAIPIAPPQADR